MKHTPEVVRSKWCNWVVIIYRIGMGGGAVFFPWEIPECLPNAIELNAVQAF